MKRVFAFILLVSMSTFIGCGNTGTSLQKPSSAAVKEETTIIETKADSGAKSASMSEGEDKDWFAGTINDDMKIHIKLTVNGSKVSGLYFYDDSKKNIELTGNYDSSDKSFEASEKGSKGSIEGIYISANLIEGEWSDGKNTYPMYLIKEGTKISAPEKTDDYMMKWNGDWEGIHKDHFNTSRLLIKPLFKNIIHYKLQVNSGLTFSFLSGFALFSNNVAVSAGHPSHDGGDNVYLKFSINQKGNVKLDSNDYGYGCVTDVKFDSEYTKEPINLKPLTAKGVGLVDTDEQEKIFKELTGTDYNAFLQFSQFCRKANDLDGLGSSVKKLDVRGCENAAIVMMRARDNTFWAAVVSLGAVHYYTNDKSSEIPKTIANWRKPDEMWKTTIK